MAVFDPSKPLDHLPHEEFAQAVVRLNNQAAAWREVYQPGPEIHARVSWNEACKLAARHDVNRRIAYLRFQGLERTMVSVQELMQDLHDLATADPTEITRHIIGCCRCCHGEGFAYQWKDADEYADACVTIERQNVERASKRLPLADLPTCDGGFGFDAHRPPHVQCPECMGVGIRTVWVADTTQLSDKARKLLTGQMDKAGLPILKDQLQARDQLHKIAGAYKVNGDGQSLTPPVAQPGDASKAADPAQTYLGMVHGRKAG